MVAQISTHVYIAPTIPATTTMTEAVVAARKLPVIKYTKDQTMPTVAADLSQAFGERQGLRLSSGCAAGTSLLPRLEPKQKDRWRHEV